MKYLLVGPNQGKNVNYQGFVFRNGVCEVPDEQTELIEAANRLLPRFHSAYPESQVVERADGKLHLDSDVEEPESAAIGLPFTHAFLLQPAGALPPSKEPDGSGEPENGKGKGKKDKVKE